MQTQRLLGAGTDLEQTHAEVNETADDGESVPMLIEENASVDTPNGVFGKSSDQEVMVGDHVGDVCHCMFHPTDIFADPRYGQGATEHLCGFAPAPAPACCTGVTRDTARSSPG